MTQTRTQASSQTQIDNEFVSVTKWSFKPQAETGWHKHAYDYIVVPLDSGNLLLENRDNTSMAELVTGQSYFRQAGVEHNVINANDYDFSFVEIELKANT